MIDERLSAALVLHTSVGRNMYPRPDPDAVREAFPDGADELIARVAAIEAEALEIPVDWRKADIWSDAEYVVGVMRERHAELSEEVLDALGSFYSFTMK